MNSELIELLRRRLAIIADQPWRLRDPDGHLDALKEVSLSISAWTDAHWKTLDGQLRHYLKNASFNKALDHLEALEAKPTGL